MVIKLNGMVIELNGQKHEIATCYEELKTKHYVKIITEWDIDKPIEKRDYFKLFCILTDTEFTKFANTATNEVTIWNATRWVIEQPFKFNTEVPKVLDVGKLIQIPKKPEYLSAAQNIVCRQELEKLPSRICEDCKKEDCDKCGGVGFIPVYEGAVSIATAIYLQPLISESKFDYEKMLEVKEKIDDMPASLIYPVGFFLLKNVITHGSNYTNNSKGTRINLGTIYKRVVQRVQMLTG